MARRDGRAMKGLRVNEGVPDGRWKTLTLVGAVGISGWVATMTIDAPTDGGVFLCFLEYVLCPNLNPGQLMVMDNLAAHKVDGVGEIIQQTGADVYYLPPYSPDFNPIEKYWAQVKQRLRTLLTLCDALDESLATLTTQNAAAYFKHCGYTVYLI